MEQKVQVEIRFPPDTPRCTAAAVRVCVEDVSLADARATTVAERVLERVEIGPGATLATAVRVGKLEPRARYNVRVHVDTHDTGSVAAGDLVSTQSHPVLSDGWPTSVVVPLRVV